MEGYKHTELGWIPEDWDLKQFANIAEVIMGQSPDGSTYNQDGKGIPLLNGPTEFTERYPVKIQWTSSPTKVCAVDDILLCVRGSSTGRINVANDKYCIGRGIAAIRATAENDHSFVEYQLNNAVEKILGLTTGSTFPSIDSSSLKSIDVLVPPIIQQRKIAQILSVWDKSIETLTQLIVAKQQLKKGLMQQLLSGKERLPGFKGEWREQELIDYCIKSKRAIVDGPFGSNLKTIHFRKQGIPVINSSFVTDLVFRPEEYVYVDEELFIKEIRSKVSSGDIIMAKIGARCGASAIMPEGHPDSILSGNSLKISIDTQSNSTLFIWYQLLNEYQVNQFKDCKSVGAQPSISIPELKKIRIKAPEKSEQEEIARVLSNLDKEIMLIEQNMEFYKLQKQGLMQQLLTGKKRVKV